MSYKNRNILQVAEDGDGSGTGVTPEMVHQARDRILAAGGILDIWCVLQEDTYETSLGDGFYLFFGGIALNEDDAQRLAELDANQQWYRWHIRRRKLGLVADAPAFLDEWPFEELFTIADVVAILAEIPPGGSVSRLLTGSGWKGRSGPDMLALPQG